MIARALFVAIAVVSPAILALEPPPPIEFANKWRAVAVELVVPDVRLEWSARGTDALFAWPIALQLNGSEKTGPLLDGTFITAFAEPQWKPGTVRFAGGFRWTQLFEPFGFFAEAGAIAGTDGRGGFVGGGPCAGFEIVQLGVVYRRTWTDVGARSDVSLDLVFPFSEALSAF